MRFARSPARFKLVAAGRRSGKTAACASELVERALVDLDAPLPRISAEVARLYWIVAPTYLLLRRPFDLITLAVDRRLIVERRPRAVPPYIHLVGDIRIEGRSAEHPETLASEGLDGVWLDEAAVMRREVWQEVRPMLADRGGWGLFSSRPRGRNWFHELWQAAVPPEWARFAWTSAEGGWVAAEEIAQAERTMPPRWFRREFMASWEAFEGQVYEEFDAARHVFAGPVDGARYRRVVAGVDWGYANPGAIIIAGVTSDGDLDVIGEEIAVGRPIAEWCERMRELRLRWRVSTFFADPSEPAYIDQARRVVNILGADNEVHAGIAAVAALLHARRQDGAPRLRIHSSCERLIATLPTYAWEETRHGRSEQPAKGQDDHALDALRYLVREQTRRPLVRALA